MKYDMSIHVCTSTNLSGKSDESIKVNKTSSTKKEKNYLIQIIEKNFLSLINPFILHETSKIQRYI